MNLFQLKHNLYTRYTHVCITFREPLKERYTHNIHTPLIYTKKVRVYKSYTHCFHNLIGVNTHFIHTVLTNVIHTIYTLPIHILYTLFLRGGFDA